MNSVRIGETRRLTDCRLQRGTSDLLGGQKKGFESFVSSRNSLLINIYSYQDLVPVLATFAWKVDNVVESSAYRLARLSSKKPDKVFSLVANQIILHIEPLNNTTIQPCRL